ncbi:MAG: sulfite exporter TauE/SafE family protein [Pedosphaera sp.]|nr:sulfite exporter TauE/SafE family protein [Pedosphaera sp.]
MNYLIAAIIGLVSGVTSGLFGVGGGIVMVPAMMFLLSPPIRDIKQAIGTSLVVIIPTALMGSFKHFQQGNVEWRTALSLAPLAIAGSYLGAWLTTHIPADNLKRAFGGFIILVGLRLLLWK